MIPEIRPTAELVGRNREYAKGAAYVTALKELPLGRVVNDKKVEDHHAIIPTKSEHDLSKMRADEKKIYDLVAKRFLAIFHPDAVFERTRVETTVAEHVFRTSGRVLLEAGWRSVYGQEADSPDKPEDDSGGDQLLPKLELGEDVETRRVESLRKETQPPRRFTEASLLGRDGDGGQGHRGRRAARGDEGLGHRHSGDPRVDHRAADLRGVHRARGHGRYTPPRRASRSSGCSASTSSPPPS